MRLLSAFACAALLLVAPALAEDASLDFGGDHYGAGQSVTITTPVARDAFLAGSDLTLGAPVSGDAHLAGFDLNANAAVTGNLYAMGFSVTVTAPIGGDVTAAGNNVTLAAGGTTTGNIRAAGQNVTISAPVQGSALISAQTFTLDAPVTGDLTFIGETLTFAPGAKVSGKVLLRAPKEIAVPESVASADRVTYEALVTPDYMGEAGKTAQNVAGKFWPAVWAAAIWWLLLFVVGLIFIALMPRGLEALRETAARRPWRTLGMGILAFASTLGLVPVVAMTLIGILLLPLVLIYIFIACSLAYLCGVYVLGVRIGSAFRPIQTNTARAVALAIALVVAGLIALIPMLGWLVTLVILVYGFGTIARTLLAPRAKATGVSSVPQT